MIPYLYGGNAHPGSAVSGSLSLPSNGGSVAIPFIVPARMIASSITAHTADTSGTHTLEAAWYPDGSVNGAPLMSSVGIAGTWVYTSSAAAVRTGNTTDVELYPGAWWLVIRNAGATTTALGRVAPGALGGSMAATAILPELAQSLAGVLWAKTTSLPLVRVNGIIEAVPDTGFA